MKSFNILGVPVNNLSQAQSLETIEGYIASAQPHQVATVNNEFIVEAQANRQFMEALQSADLALADSTGVLWASRWLGHPLPSRIAGSDLTEILAQTGAEKGWRFFLLGGQGDVAQAAGRILQQRHPKLQIVGAEAGPIIDQAGQAEIDQTIARIVKARPDILLVAFGAPKQDLFIYENKKQLGIPVMIGVGGTFDFIAGRVRRAPRLLRQLGLEWLWRLVQQPSRFKRIWRALVIFPLLVIFKRRPSR